LQLKIIRLKGVVDLNPGGGDAVSTALTMAFFHLGQNPEICTELTSSIRSHFPTFDSINASAAGRDISLLDAVPNEAMRVSSILPGPMWRRTGCPVSKLLLSKQISWHFSNKPLAGSLKINKLLASRI
jgi:hypothetical protein